MRKSLPRAVIVLGVASFFTDVSSEMIYPLLPAFLATVLGASALSIGLIEGVAESTAALFKIVSGYMSDRSGQKKKLVVLGYGLSGLSRPLIGLAGSWPMVLLFRFSDRIGKGVRSSPRDALIADVTPEDQRGRAYGVHRAFDNAGSVLGPLVAGALMAYGGLAIRQVFLLAAVPAAVVMAILVFGVERDAPRPKAEGGKKPFTLFKDWKLLGPEFKAVLLALILFTLGNSTDAFLLLRLTDAGVPAPWIVTLWSLLSVVKMVSSYAGGRVSDRVGHRRMILAGWLYYAVIYLALARFQGRDELIAAFLAYGLFFGFTEPSERALVASYAPPALRGTAFGWFHFVVGLGALPASLLFGAVWKAFGVSAAFGLGAALALAAATLLLFAPAALRRRE